jgi:hypothetical protein
MKLAYDGPTFEQGGFQATAVGQGLGRKHLRKVTMLLTSGLYKKPKDAVLGELVSNGFDSKLNAIVQVFLPTTLSPALVVRDDGPGMSHQFMMERYTIVTDSTKDDSDDNIGGFGIGRLTPFADGKEQYTVTCYRGDHKQIYNVALVDFEITINATQPMALAEPEWGVEVRIPVPMGEHYQYREAAARVLRFFPQDRVKVVGADIERPKYTFECEDYAILKQSTYSSTTPSYALLGPKAYAFDAASISIPNFPANNIEFRFNLGEVTPTPDREGLKLDPKTLAALGRKHTRLMADLENQIEREIANATSLYEAQEKFFDTFTSMQAMHQFLPKSANWGTHKIDGIRIDARYNYVRENLTSRKTPTRHEGEFKRTPGGYHRESRLAPHFLVDDVDGVRMLARCKMHADQNNDFSHLFIMSQAAVDKLAPPPDRVFKASSYIPPVMARRGSVATGKLRAYRWKRRHECSWNESPRWCQDDVAVETGGFYFEFKSSNPPQWADEIRDTAWFGGHRPVYGLPGEFRKRAVMDEWTEAVAWTRERAMGFLNDPLFQRELVWDVARGRLNDDVVRFVETAVTADPLVASLVKVLKDNEPTYLFDEGDKVTVRRLLNLNFITNPNPLPVPDLVGVQQLLLEQRPVFAELIARSCNNQEILIRSLELQA